MQTKAKANSQVTHAFDAATNELTIKVTDAGNHVLRLNAVSATCRNRAAVHGFIQRVVDAAAIPSEPIAVADPKAADPVAEKARVAAYNEALRISRAVRKSGLMGRLVEHYNTGSDEWSPAREAGVIGLDGILLRAVMEVTGKDEPAVRALIATQAATHKVTERAYLAKLGTGAKVAEVANRMRAEGASDVDADAELDALMAEPEPADDESDDIEAT